jgi:hypothetical protein
MFWVRENAARRVGTSGRTVRRGMAHPADLAGKAIAPRRKETTAPRTRKFSVDARIRTGDAILTRRASTVFLRSTCDIRSRREVGTLPSANEHDLFRRGAVPISASRDRPLRATRVKCCTGSTFLFPSFSVMPLPTRGAGRLRSMAASHISENLDGPESGSRNPTHRGIERIRAFIDSA